MTASVNFRRNDPSGRVRLATESGGSPNIRHCRSRILGRAVLCSKLAEQRHGIIRKGLALLGEESVSEVTGGTAAGSTSPTHARGLVGVA
jgi:hypothetical protein